MKVPFYKFLVKLEHTQWANHNVASERYAYTPEHASRLATASYGHAGYAVVSVQRAP